MQQTIIMKNLKAVYYKNGVIDKNTAPFFLSFLLYSSKDQFNKDKESRKKLISNTLDGIANLRWLMNSQNYYSVSQYTSIEFEFYIDFCKEIIDVIIEKKWRTDVVLKSVQVISESNLSRRIIGDSVRPWLLKNASIFGINKSNKPEGFKLEKELKLYLAELDKKYNRYIVDDII